MWRFYFGPAFPHVFGLGHRPGLIRADSILAGTDALWGETRPRSSPSKAYKAATRLPIPQRRGLAGSPWQVLGQLKVPKHRDLREVQGESEADGSYQQSSHHGHRDWCHRYTANRQDRGNRHVQQRGTDEPMAGS